MLELATLDILFDVLDRTAVMIIENVDNAILVEEWNLNDVIEPIGVNFAPDSSIFAILTLLHGLSQSIENFHLIWRQS